MKKLARLERARRLYGPEAVVPTFVCRTWPEIADAVDHFRDRGIRCGLRTDTPGGDDQGACLPFLYDARRWSAAEVYAKHGASLVYLVSESIGPEASAHNVAAIPVSRTTLLVEWDAGGCAQREWEHQPAEFTQRAYVSRWDRIEIVGGEAVETRHPSALPGLGLERMMDGALATPELTVWTVARDGRVIVW